jgi:DNA-binding transcriptional LysR family regulator
MVAELLSFSRAAERLFISQPALSRQIKKLENDLGVTLLDRQPNELKLTDTGVFFLEQAKDILQQTQQMIKNIKTHARTENTLHIGYIPTTLQSFLGNALHQFGKSYPKVAIRLQEMPPSKQVKALREGLIDIAFMGHSPDELEKDFMVKFVKQVRIVAVLADGHALARRESIHLAELTNETFIGISEETFPGGNTWIRDVCRHVGFTPKLELLADSHASMIALVIAGQGVAIMPEEAAVLPHLQAVFMTLNAPIYYAQSTAVWRKGTLTQPLDNFLTILSITDHP